MASFGVMTSIKSFKTGQLVVNRMKTDELDHKSVFLPTNAGVTLVVIQREI
jgi:hypothetical protein